MGMGVRKASSPFRKDPARPTKSAVFDTVRSPKGDAFSVMDRHAFDSAAGRADKVLERVLSGTVTRDAGTGKRR